MQSEFVFAPGGYAMDLEGELAKALQARTEMLARKRNPKLWRLTDQMQSFAASGPEQKELQRRRIIGYGMTAVLFLAAAALLIFGFTEPRDRRMIAIGGVCALLAVSRVLPLVTTGSSITRYAKAAHQHLTSLRAADFSQKPTIRFTEDKMRIQSNLGSESAMAFDECVENPANDPYAKASCERTARWLARCKEALARYNAEPDAVNPGQQLWGINQGATFKDLRIWHMQEIAKLDLPGYAIGGLAVGEPTEVMYEIIEAVEPYMPKDRPRYLMGVGTPSNIIESVARGVDFFDCVMPARNARHAKLFTWQGSINLKNAKYTRDDGPIDPQCVCPVCRRYSRAYLHHLFKAEEMLAMRLSVMHNLYFYNTLTRRIRDSLDAGTFGDFRAEYSRKLAEKI